VKISVIIPVFNEQNTINEILSRISTHEIIVADCNNATNDVITGENIIKITSKQGRSSQMNSGAKCATGDVLLFLHADTVLPENWHSSMENALKNADYGAFSLGIDSKRPIYRIIEVFVNLRTRITHIPYGDQAIFMKKEHFKGYEDYPLFEDFRLMQDAKRTGLRFALIKDKVRTSPRRWEKEGIMRTTLRNWLITIRYLTGTHPAELKRYYGDGR